MKQNLHLPALGLVALLLLPGVSTAQEATIEGVYARSPEICAAAKKDLQTLFENGETVLTKNGIEGIEYHCEFVDLKSSGSTPGWIATALCEEPGYAFPDLLVIMPRGAGELEVTSVRPAGEDGNSGNAGMYYQCEGVSMP